MPQFRDRQNANLARYSANRLGGVLEGRRVAGYELDHVTLARRAGGLHRAAHHVRRGLRAVHQFYLFANHPANGTVQERIVRTSQNQGVNLRPPFQVVVQ